MKRWLVFAVAAWLSGCGPQETDAPLSDASGGSSEAAPSVAVGKPQPVAPPVQPGVTLGSELPPKPALSPELRSAATAWSATLTASTSELWPTQYATLTATASADVGPTPYYIRIWDQESGSFLGSCGFGTTCSVSVTRPTSAYGSFVAIIGDLSGNEVARSYWVGVHWHPAYLTMSASPTTLPVGSSTTLTVNASYDVGPSPFYIEIFDSTTGTLLKSCGTGTVCSVQATESTAGTHTYQAFLSQYGATFPPTGIQESPATQYVTWTSSGWSLSLSTDTSATYSYVTLTATASVNVGPTPYYIQIFDENGTRIATCGSGTTCTVQYWPSLSGNALVAFIATASGTLPPPNVQASSNVVSVALLPPPG